MKSHAVSLILATYNQPIDLALHLRTLAAQTINTFEILIADDGSGPETQTVIERFAPQFGPRLKHVWQEDRGFRKAKILNQTIRESCGRQLIFTDSDSILHPRFVQDHVERFEPNSLFMGRRVDLSRGVSDWIRRHPEALFTWRQTMKILQSALGSDSSRNVRRIFRIDSPVLIRLFHLDRVPDLLGSNFSICRDLLYQINGFDENFLSYWGEDGDIFIRARNAGAKIHGRKSYAIQLHLWHPRREVDPTAVEEYHRNLQRQDYKVCSAGIKSLS